jgi:hypothetical protein
MDGKYQVTTKIDRKIVGKILPRNDATGGLNFWDKIFKIDLLDFHKI